jgi:hypothetical protein
MVVTETIGVSRMEQTFSNVLTPTLVYLFYSCCSRIILYIFFFKCSSKLPSCGSLFESRDFKHPSGIYYCKLHGFASKTIVL